MSMRLPRQTCLAVMLCVALSWLPAHADALSASASITLHAGGKTRTLDRKALDAMPQTQATAAAHEDKPSQWGGVALQDVLAQSVPHGQSLRGRNLATFVRITASDGYQIVFSVAELDPNFGNTRVILADSKDGQPLDKDGPYRLIVPGDKRPARWIRNITQIDVVDGTAGK
ncbi:molybdopterin-dependent oxidoreductase [Dyella sp.]|uniref:molybdopterin-dependent oxidoreductase n=1 Tax=Dyella sp. TaxID=1869338 RepID=UPI002ED354C9